MNRHQRLEMLRVARHDSGLHLQSLGGDQDIGIEGSGIGSWLALLPGHGPQSSSPSPGGSRDWQVGEDSVQLVEAVKS